MKLVRRETLVAGVTLVTFARPERRNAVTGRMAEEVEEAIGGMLDDGVRVGVLAADGPAFCAGADLSDLVDGGTALDRIVDALANSPVHWTAAVDGAVRGGGISILGACARVLATTESTFGMPEIHRGFFPSAVAAAEAPRIGARSALRLALTADVLDAAAAKEMGWVDTVVPREQLRTRLVSETTWLSSLDPASLLAGVSFWREHRP
jgi:enoyl-CoA hydratase/carnithine racemase